MLFQIEILRGRVQVCAIALVVLMMVVKVAVVGLGGLLLICMSSSCSYQRHFAGLNSRESTSPPSSPLT